MFNNCALQDRWNQCTSDTCSTREHATWDRLLELLGYGTLLSQNGVAGGKNKGRGDQGTCVAESFDENGT